MAILDLIDTLVWVALLVVLLWPVWQRRLLEVRRVGGLERLGRARGSRAIALIARRETDRLLGFPLRERQVFDLPEGVLRAIGRTPPRTPIDLVLHVGPEHSLAAEQIAHALVRHAGRVTVFVPYRAGGGGLLIALAANEIILDPNAVLGPVAPQVGPYPAASLLLATRDKDAVHFADETLILADQARKVAAQSRALITELLLARAPEREDAEQVAGLLAGFDWTPHYPILFEEARRLGLPVGDELPPEVHALMELYDTTTAQRPTVSRA